MSPCACLPPRLLVRMCPPLFFTATDTTELYTLSLHDALPISGAAGRSPAGSPGRGRAPVTPASTAPARAGSRARVRSEEHTSELQSLTNLVCRLLLEKKKTNKDSEEERGRP